MTHVKTTLNTDIVKHLHTDYKEMAVTPSKRTYLNDIWSVYFHNNSINWDMNSFIFIHNISSVESFCEIFDVFQPLWLNGMFFIFREHITPRWEDDNNVNGGCYSIKLSKEEAEEKWFELCSDVLGEVFGKDDTFSDNINGISITPKKNANLVRIWMKDSKNADSSNYNFKLGKGSTLVYKQHEQY